MMAIKDNIQLDLNCFRPISKCRAVIKARVYRLRTSSSPSYRTQGSSYKSTNGPSLLSALGRDAVTAWT